MKKLISSSLVFAILFSVIVMMSTQKADAATAYSSAGIISTNSSSLTVRKSASSSSSALAYLSKGSYVTLISKSGSWWYVEYDNAKYGYCHSGYITQIRASKAGYINTSSGNLNIRSGADTSYSVKAQLAKGKNIVIVSESNGWSKILYNGRSIGYASSKYIALYSSYSAISLSVPSYKQTDSRWSRYPLGTTGNTIGTVGCATTALAMSESYRTGTTIYPNQMAAKLSYTSGGAVYWHGNYTISTSSNYLQIIYNCLKEGKPVVVGAKKSTGSQHWVVVKGCTSASSLSASNFIINDPGSSYRTTLQQFFNSYPSFYKLLYY